VKLEPVRLANSALVWLLINDDGRDIMISDPAALNVRARAREVAGAQGVTLVYPTGDETDSSAVSVNDFLESNIDSIDSASDRYELSTRLIGYLHRDGSRTWRGEWVKIVDDERSEASFESSNLDDALQKGIAVLTGATVSDSTYRYGGEASSGTEGLVWVGSIGSLADYASLMRFFEAVPNVATVYPKEVGDDTAVFAVIPRGALRDIETAAQSQRWLLISQVSSNGFANELSSNADLAIEINR